jgi:hypothetical protein
MSDHKIRIRRRYRVDAVTYSPLPGGLAFMEVGRIPGGRLYRFRRSALRAADSYDRFWELTATKTGGHTRYEVVDTLRPTGRS